VLLLKYVVSLRAFNTASFRCLVLKTTTPMESTQSRNKSCLAVKIVPSDFHSVEGLKRSFSSAVASSKVSPVWHDAYLCIQPSQSRDEEL